MIINGYVIKSGANLSRANLRGANLRNADLHSADLSDATGIFDLGMPHRYQVHMVSHHDSVRIKAGCRWMTWEEANKYWRGEGDRKPRSAALLVYARAVADSLGWRL